MGALQRINTENWKQIFPGKGIARPQSQFPHSCVCKQFKYPHHRSAYSAAGNTICGQILEIHRHMNVEIGTEAAQFLEKEYINEIFVAVAVII
jgi:hypothetical protein